MILPTILLQKPSARSKAKDHSLALSRRIEMWKKGELNELMREVRHIQKSFVVSRKPRSLEEVAKNFARLMLQGNVSTALKLLDTEGHAGILEMNEQTLDKLKEKHPAPAPIQEGSLLFGPINDLPGWYFDQIDQDLILNSAIKTRVSAGPSGLDADAYR